MKARVLKKILNDTTYNVHNKTDHICIGSTLCSDLISVNKETLKLKYALDTWKEGRAALAKDDNPKNELLFIWDKLQELIDNGEIHDIINGDDELENKLPVFTINYDGELIETYTDKYGYPNITISGEMMYNNSYHSTKKAAIDYGIREFTAGINMIQKTIDDCEEKLSSYKEDLKKEQKALDHFKSLKKNLI